jgi:uncharacterized protein YjbI with pentapeptide repeats
MADKTHVRIVMAGADSLEDWRAKNSDVRLDLRGADLCRGKLESVNLCFADCRGADMSKADLRWADLVEADLSDANLTRADFFKADLSSAKLCRVQLKMTNFEDADLSNADLTDAIFADTRMLNTDFTGAKGLETCHHPRTSTIDQESIAHCDDFPAEFLKGCGLSDREVKAAAMKLAQNEVFNDLLDEAFYLLTQGYKDAAAVYIGIVLERHLRQLCSKHGIDLANKNKKKPKMARDMNQVLYNKKRINQVDWESITSWVGIRNKAAHGHVEAYNIEQVENMYRGVVEFLSRVQA